MSCGPFPAQFFVYCSDSRLLTELRLSPFVYRMLSFSVNTRLPFSDQCGCVGVGLSPAWVEAAGRGSVWPSDAGELSGLYQGAPACRHATYAGDVDVPRSHCDLGFGAHGLWSLDAHRYWLLLRCEVLMSTCGPFD